MYSSAEIRGFLILDARKTGVFTVGTQPNCSNLTITELENISDSITLDTPLVEAYQGVSSMNSHVSGDYPVLLPGPNAISWSGNVSRVLIQPRWRDL